MKIVHFIPTIDQSHGGTTILMKALANELNKHIDLIIVAGKSLSPIQIDQVRVEFIDISVKRLFLLKKEFKAFLINEKPDLVHVNTLWKPQSTIFQYAAQELGLKVVLSTHGMLEPWIMQHHPLRKKLAMLFYQRKGIKKADILHTTCEMEKKHILQLGFTNKFVVIPYILNLLSYPEPKSNYDTKKVVFLSRIHQKKGIEHLLDAWKEINHHDWTLEIAGNGEQKYIEQLNKKIKKQNISNVSLVGSLFGGDKWDFLKSADIFVLPTFSENFGIVVPEALAVGLPVITTKGAPWEELETENCGWWIDLSVKNLNQALQTALSKNPKELQQLGKNGRKLIFEKYSDSEISKKFISLYNRIIIDKILT